MAGGGSDPRSGGASVFFCSSRRRHTRLQGDWSSDVCSSDLLAALYAPDLLQSPASRASQERLAAYLNRPGVTLQDLSIYSWKDAKGEIRVVNLRASSKAFAEGLPLRQYWRKTGGR